MSFKSNIRSTTLEAMERISKVDNAIKDLEKHNDMYSKVAFDREMASLTEERKSIFDETHKHTDALTKEYQERKRDEFTPHGADITEDAALLTCSINISEEELKRLFDKYAGNYTMQRLICDYAKKINVKDGAAFFPGTADKYIEAADILNTYAHQALISFTHAEVFKNEAMYDRITSNLEE